MLDLLAALLEIFLESFGEAVFQFAVEFIGTLIFPHPLFHPSRIPGLSVVISPVLAGGGMWMVGTALRKRNKKAMQIESFGYGFAFALGMAMVRFLFAK